jgi:hypothetical protein
MPALAPLQPPTSSPFDVPLVAAPAPAPAVPSESKPHPATAQGGGGGTVQDMIHLFTGLYDDPPEAAAKEAPKNHVPEYCLPEFTTHSDADGQDHCNLDDKSNMDLYMEQAHRTEAWAFHVGKEVADKEFGDGYYDFLLDSKLGGF